jgi:Na+-transporting NADH:ubiquinone oxidoreductase subunit NqrB
MLVLAAVNLGWATSVGSAGFCLAVAVLTAGAVDVVAVGLRGWGWRVPYGAFVTGGVLGMVLDPTVGPGVVAAFAAGAVLVKHVLRIGRRPVFNPAALALVVAGLIGVQAQSWWGAAAAPVYLGVPVLLVAVLLVADRANRLPAVGAFLGTWFAALTILVSLGFNAELAVAYREPLLSMAIYFAGIMLLDPPTSPGLVRQQYLFGFIVAVVGIVLLAVAHESAFLPVGLLAGNAWLAVDRLRNRMRATAATTRSAP